MNKEVTGIILMAGSSTRYNKGYNKNFELINNKPIFYYSLEVMSKIDNIKEIILVIKKEEEKVVFDYINSFNLKKEISIAFGGNTRKESVYNALIKSKYPIVLIHDGARPLIKKRYVDECISNIGKYQGVIIGIPVKDTIKIINNKNEIVSSTDRKLTYIGQTPQCFIKKVLLACHQKYKNDNDITDDSMLLERENIKVKLLEGSYTNIKITTKEDYLYIKELLEEGE